MLANRRNDCATSCEVNPVFVMVYWLWWSVSLIRGFAMYLGSGGLVWQRTEKVDANHTLIRFGIGRDNPAARPPRHRLTSAATGDADHDRDDPEADERRQEAQPERARRPRRRPARPGPRAARAAAAEFGRQARPGSPPAGYPLVALRIAVDRQRPQPRPRGQRLPRLRRVGAQAQQRRPPDAAARSTTAAAGAAADQRNVERLAGRRPAAVRSRTSGSQASSASAALWRGR